MEFEEMKELLRKSLPYKRFKHSVAVCETAEKIAKAHGLPMEKIRISALLHDCGREIPSRENLNRATELGIEIDEIEANQPILLHAKLGVHYAREKYGVTDEEILRGILFHTTGNSGMSELEKIVYLADLLEPTRDFPGIGEMRSLVMKDLDATMVKAYAQTIRYLLEYDLLIHPHCLEGYNELAIRAKKDSREKKDKA